MNEGGTRTTRVTTHTMYHGQPCVLGLRWGLPPPLARATPLSAVVGAVSVEFWGFTVALAAGEGGGGGVRPLHLPTPLKRPGPDMPLVSGRATGSQ